MGPGRRFAKYLYVADLLRRPRVLEIGAGDGAGCRFVSQHGAREVLGLETSEAAVRAAYQRALPRGVALRVGTYSPLELPDRAYDLALVPEGGELLRVDGFLEDLRRVVRPEGALVMGVPVGPDPHAVYQEVLELLEPLFGPVRMVGLAAFGGCSLSEYTQPGDDLSTEVALDASLAEGEDDVIEYLAVAGDRSERRRGYVIVQAPLEAEPEPQPAGIALAEHDKIVREATARVAALEAHVERREELLVRGAAERVELDRQRQAFERRVAELEAASREPDPRVGEQLEELVASLEDERDARAELLSAAAEHARREAELSAELGEQGRYAEELERDLRRASERVRELTTALGVAQRKIDEEAAETRRLRSRVAAFEGAELADRLRGQAPADPERVAALERELDKANQRWRAAEDKNDELWRKVGNAEKEAVEAREGAAKRALEQKGVHQQNLMRAVEEAGRKLASAQDEAARERRDATAARTELTGARAELGAARSELAAAHTELAAARTELAGARTELVEEQAELAAARTELVAAHGELVAAARSRTEREEQLTAETLRLVAEAEERAISLSKPDGNGVE